MKLTSTILILLFTACGGVLGQSLTENFIKTYRATVPIQGDLTGINNKNKVSETINYFDGLGRSIQTVNRQNSALGYDVVNFSVYDGYGRQTKAYLSYTATSNDGSLKAAPIDEQSLFYQSLAGVNAPSSTYSQNIYENSALDRVLKISAPGLPWQANANDPYSLDDRTVKKRLFTNAQNEVILFSYNESTGAISVTDYYHQAELSAMVTYDEHNNQLIEFVDKEGRTVCKKVQVEGTAEAPVFASTYYVYDDYGNLVVVVPPEGVEELTKNQQN